MHRGRGQSVGLHPSTPSAIPTFHASNETKKHEKMKRIPNAIKKLSGSKYYNPNEPEYSPGIGEPPPILTGLALACWHETVKELDSVGIGTKVESYALACYCMAVKSLHDAETEISKHGLIVQTERGFTKNPAFTIQSTAMVAILRFANAFGLTPASRGTVTASPKKTANPFDVI